MQLSSEVVLSERSGIDKMRGSGGTHNTASEGISSEIKKMKLASEVILSERSVDKNERGGLVTVEFVRLRIKPIRATHPKGLIKLESS